MSSEIYAFCAGIFAGVMLFVGVSSAMYDRTSFYKQGQIDALSGKVVFELKKQEDGSTKWQRIEK
jgi:hypothetical protein